MFASSLAKLFVEFTVKGFDQTKLALDLLQKLTDKLDAAFKKAQPAAASLFGIISGKVGGFVGGGLVGTSQGAVIAQQFHLLSLEVAGIFLPVIQKATDALRNVVNWFRNLSGAQQDQIQRWLGFSIATLGLATYLPRVSTGLALVGTALKALAVNPFIALVSVLGGLLLRTEAGRAVLLEFANTAMAVAASLVSIADTIMMGLAPTLDVLSEALSTAVGKSVAFGLAVLVFAPRIIAAVRAMALAFATLGGGIIGVLSIVGGLVAIAAATGAAAGKALVDSLVKEVKAGTKTMAQALKDIDEEAKEKKRAVEFARQGETWGEGTTLWKAAKGFNLAGPLGDIINQEIDQLTALQKRRLEFLTKGQEDHRLPTPNKTGFESVADTFKRLQLAANRIEDPNRKTQLEQLTVLHWINEGLDRLNKAIRLQNPAVGN